MSLPSVRRPPAVLATCVLAACAEAPPTPSLEELRTATSRYRDVTVAVADGYVRDPLDICETPYSLGIFEDLGVMGVHYLRRDLLGIDEEGSRLDATTAHTDFLQPAVLVYEPQADSTLALVAIANVVSAAAWEGAGNREPPAFGDAPFAYAPANPGTGFAAHYDLHIWLYRDNPSGLFAPYNPAVTCEHHQFNMPMIMPPDAPPGMVHH
jgi:hypothetical protein